MGLSAGPQRIGLADDLAALAPGVYLARLAAPGFTAAARVVKIGS